MQRNARAAVIQSDLTSSAEVLNIDKAKSGSFPQSIALADGGKGLPASKDTTYQYTVNNASSPKTFCLTGTNGTITYHVTESSGPEEGVCP